jgi:hypothetical protein
MSERLTLTTADGNEARQLTVPTSWADVTLNEYLALAVPGIRSPASVLTDLAPELLDNLPDAARTLLGRCLSFAQDHAPLLELLPTPGLFEIGKCAYGLYQQAAQYVADYPGAPALARGAYLYALYRNPTSSKMDHQLLALAHAAVLARPVTEVYADCAHFLASYERALTGTSLPGPFQPGVLRVVLPTPEVKGWRAKLGNLWSSSKKAVA